MIIKTHLNSRSGKFNVHINYYYFIVITSSNQRLAVRSLPVIIVVCS